MNSHIKENPNLNFPDIIELGCACIQKYVNVLVHSFLSG